MSGAGQERTLVSIVVITYNSSQFVLETLESCRAQTYQYIELIISDDASTDNTVELCEEWCKTNSNRFVKWKIVKATNNIGIAGNMNRAVKASTAAWFKLCAGDDLLLPNCIEDNVNAVRGFPADCSLVSSKRVLFKEVDREVDIVSKKSTQLSVFFHSEISATDQYQLALRNISPSVTSLFMHQKTFLSFGGCDERFPNLEDWPNLLNFLHRSHKCYYLDKNTVMYRINDSSIFRKNMMDQLYRSWSFQSYYPVIWKYIYPHITIGEKLYYKYTFYIALFFKNTGLNKRNLLTWFLSRALTYPADYFYRLFKNRLQRKYKKKYGAFK